MKWLLGLAFLLSSPSTSFAYQVGAVTGTFQNHSHSVPERFEITGNCYFRRTPFDSPRTCGSVTKNIQINHHGVFRVPAFKIPSSAPIGKKIWYTLEAKVIMPGGEVVSPQFPFFDENGPLHKQIKHFTLWGVRSIAQKLFLRTGAPAGEWMKTLRSKSLLVELDVNMVVSPGNPSYAYSSAERIGDDNFSFPVVGSNWRLVPYATPARPIVSAEYRISDGLQTYFLKRFETEFHPDILGEIKPNIILNAPQALSE